jgi:hypothetical protein
MKKKSFFLRWMLCLLAVILSAAPHAHAADVAKDADDPLFIARLGDFVSRSSMDVGKYFQARQIAIYGFSNRFSLAADIRWRGGAPRGTNGFSNIGVMGTYRAGQGNTGATDVLVGFGFGGQGVVPNYSDEVYSVGVKTGKQWNGMTLAATVMTNWIFDDVYGMAYIDLTPEAYFRLRGDWSLGFGATLRKSTNNNFDQEWLNAKLGSVVGRTGWFVNVGYEIESKDIRIGGSLNMLF